jgi:membrane protein YqaA with SNARE-associated domain
VDHFFNLGLQWLAVPGQGLTALALAAFIAATILPLSSEAVLLAVIVARPEQAWLAISVATLANTLGSLTTYWLGRVGRSIPEPHQLVKALAWFERHGVWLLTLAWVPWIGDVLVLVAGWRRLHAGWSALAIAVGKWVRYAAVWVAWLCW